MADECYNKVAQILVDVIGVEPDDISMEADLRRDIELDSLNMLELLTNLETTFGQPVSDSDIRDLNTVGEVVAYIEAMLKQGAGSNV